MASVPLSVSPGKVLVLVTSDTYPRVDLAITNPTQWNTEWETLYTTMPILVHPNHLLSMTRTNRERHTATSASGNQLDKHSYITNYLTTCQMQTVLGKEVLAAFVGYDFETWWVNAPVEERQRHVLKALANAGAQAKNLNLARAYCSDILRLDYLSRDGEVLLGLLREVTPQDISITPKEPYWFRCQEWDEAKRKLEEDPETTEDERFDLMEVMVLRTKLIYLTLWGIVTSFIGQPLPYVTVKKERDRMSKETKTEERRKIREEYTCLYGEAGKAKLRELSAALDERKGRRGTHCSNLSCGRSEKAEEKFMRCAKCWSMVQRSVAYCGKECQVADWKNRHKQICGKLLSSVDSVLSNAQPGQHLRPPAASRFPAPTNGFKRTPQLVMHIRLLDIRPEYDYMLRIDALDPVKINIPTKQIQELFSAAQYKAFVEGDKQATVEMCHFVIWWLRFELADVHHGWDLNYAVDAMEKEFALPNLREEMKKCQEKQWQHETKRPPLITEEAWSAFLSRDLDWEVAVVGLNRRMNDIWVMIPKSGMVVRTQAIWAPDTSLSRERT